MLFVNIYNFSEPTIQKKTKVELLKKINLDTANLRRIPGGEWK